MDQTSTTFKETFPEYYNAELDLSNFKIPEAAAFSDDFTSIIDAVKTAEPAYELPIILNCGDEAKIKDLYHFPNLLLAGATGSGKTQFLYNQLALWLFTKHPAQLKLLICGTKDIDYSMFANLERHYLAGIKNEPEIIAINKFGNTLDSLQLELEERLSLFNLAGVKTIKDYNLLILDAKLHPKDGHRYLPNTVLLIDDLYNFVYNEDTISRLISILQKTSYTGIYILAVTSQINATQLSRQLKSNFVYRIGMKLMSQSDSKKILDEAGAEKLKEAGTLLFWEAGKLVRGMQPYISFSTLRELINFIGNQKGYPSKYHLPNPNALADFNPNGRDALFEDAARLIVMHQQGSTSLIQRKMKLGYNRAGLIIDQLEAAGIVGPFYGSKAREVLIPDEYALEQFLSNLDSGIISNRPYETRKIAEVIKNKVTTSKKPVKSKKNQGNLTPKIETSPKTNGFAQPKAKEKPTGFWAKLKTMFD